MQRYQFSLLRLFWASIATSTMIAVNLAGDTAVGPGVSLTVGAGKREIVLVKRGFPLRYQQSETWLKSGSLSDRALAREGRRVRITHPHWLVVDLLVGLGLVFGVPGVVRSMPTFQSLDRFQQCESRQSET